MTRVLPRPTTPRPPARSRSTAALLMAVVLVGLLVGGCARVRTALAVQPDDTVDGEIVLATPGAGPDDKGPRVTIPPDLADDIDVSAYEQDGYVGSVLRFTGLTFPQVSELQQVGGDIGRAARLEIRRVGNRVITTGSADLTTVAVDRADFQLKISYPGEITDSNGDADSSTVSWTFTPGQVDEVNVVVAFDDPNAPSALNWTLGLTALVVLAAATVVLVARRTRNRPVSAPGP
jgi:phosphatidylinositol mannoside-binding LppM-like protein